MATTQLTTTITNYSNPYKLIVDLSSTSTISSNSSVITAVIKLYCPYSLSIYGRENSITINGTKYTFNSPAINTSGGTTHTLGTVKTGAITHNTDGTKSVSVSCTFNLQATLSGTYYGAMTASGTFKLDNIPRAATLTSAPNFTDEANPTIKYSNGAGNAVTTLQACISLTGNNADVPYRDIPKTGTSYTFELTEDERKTLRAATTGSTSRTVYFYLKTIMGGATYYSKLAKTFSIIAPCAPLINSATVIDQNEATIALTGNRYMHIRGYSESKYTIDAEPRKEATITEYKVTVGGETYSGATGTITDLADGSMLFTVVDNRGMKSTLTQTAGVIDYIKPTCNLEVAMPTTEGETTLTISGNCFNGTFGLHNNDIQIQYRYKTESGNYGEWVTVAATYTGNTYKVDTEITGLDYRSTYTFQARIVDKLNTAESAEIVVRTTPVFDWSKEDFNFNVPVSMNGEQVLRYTDEDKLVLSSGGGDIYLRPNGSTVDEGQLRLSPTGKLTVGGYTLPYITTGSATLNYGSAANTVEVDFGITYATKPVVITSQVFDSANVLVVERNVTTTGFKATVQGGFASSGSRAFNWIAIGIKA